MPWYENRPRGISIPRVFFRFVPDGESRKNAFLNAIGRRSSTRLFALLRKAHSKWWYETRPRGIRSQGCFFDFRPDRGESRRTPVGIAIGRGSVSYPAFCPGLFPKPTQKDGYENVVQLRSKRVFFRLFAAIGAKVEKHPLGTQLDDVRQPGFLPCLEKPTQNDGMKTDLVEFDPKGVFSFRPDRGKVEKTRVLNAIGRRSSTRLFALLGKAKLKNAGMKTDLVELRSQGCFFVSPRWGKSKKHAF